jgi:periplasmic divalent cation tolerance protein
MMLVAWTTVALRADAERLATDVIDRGLAACVQFEGPVTSVYRWEGKTTRSEEYRLMFKFLPFQLPALKSHVLAVHPYAVPEWIVVRADHVGEKYLSWAQAKPTF